MYTVIAVLATIIGLILAVPSLWVLDKILEWAGVEASGKEKES